MLKKYQVCRGLYHGFDRSKWTTGTPQERLGILPSAQAHILAQENGRERFTRGVRELSQAFALAVPHEEALRIRDEVAFFQAVQLVPAFEVSHFSAEECQACALRPRCTRAIRAGRSVQLHPQAAELAAARELERSPAFAEYKRLRQVAEHRIARLVQLGARQSRFFGGHKTRFQLLMAAAAANLTLVWGQAESPRPQHTPPAAPQAANPRRVTGCLHALLSAVSDPSRWMAARRPPALRLGLVESRS